MVVTQNVHTYFRLMYTDSRILPCQVQFKFITVLSLTTIKIMTTKKITTCTSVIVTEIGEFGRIHPMVFNKFITSQKLDLYLRSSLPVLFCGTQTAIGTIQTKM